MSFGARNLFRFGEFELDVPAYELRRCGRSIRLEQQPLDLLILLVERHPHLVTRAEIVTTLWGPHTSVAAETAINTAVHKIRQALGDSAASPSYIARVPGKGYRFIADLVVDRDASQLCQPEDATDAGNEVPPPGIPIPIDSTRQRRRRRLIALTGVVLVTALSGAAMLMSWERPRSPMQVVPLTRLAGNEREPSFSPDGTQVAFAWDGEREDNFDIYVTVVGSADVRRLTTDAAADLAPQWSPDGRDIAYVRVRPTGHSHQLRVMSAVGGSDRAVSEFPAWYRPSWSPDGRHIAVGRARAPEPSPAVGGIHVIPVAGGEPRRVSPPTLGTDYLPSFSPRGRRIAYASCRDSIFSFDCHLRVLDLDENLDAIGPPLTLTRQQSHRRINGITWSRDGQFVIYAAGSPTSHLWRVRADASSAPQRMEEAGEGASHPVSSTASNRLAFSRDSAPTAIYRFAIEQSAAPVARSAGVDLQPDFSPDGRRFAFCSDRSGGVEVWVAGADGSPPQQLTRGPGLEQCSPAWSPDGRRIAFDSVGRDGFYQIWTIPSDGGAPRQITSARADHNVPRWSRDGQWIYFSSPRDGTRNIWRAHAETMRVEQVTKGGSGLSSSEAADGAGILYALSNSDSPLLLQASEGGDPRVVIPCVAAGSTVSAGVQGIYYLPCGRGHLAADQPIRVFDPRTSEDRVLGTLEAYYRPRDFHTPFFRKTSLSPDSHAILYSRRMPALADLMLIEGFR